MTHLAALLEREAGAEIEAILSEAQQRASEIIAQAEEEAKAIATQRERQSQSQAEAAKVRARSAAQLEASSLKLRAQHGMVEKVFEAVEADIRSLLSDGSRYAPILATLLQEAVEALGGKDNVSSIAVNPADEGAAKEAAKAHGLEDKVRADDTVQGGVKVKATSNVTIENSLFDRLQTAREELASEVSKRLGTQAAPQPEG